MHHVKLLSSKEQLARLTIHVLCRAALLNVLDGVVRVDSQAVNGIGIVLDEEKERVVVRDPIHKVAN